MTRIKETRETPEEKQERLRRKVESHRPGTDPLDFEEDEVTGVLDAALGKLESTSEQCRREVRASVERVTHAARNGHLKK